MADRDPVKTTDYSSHTDEELREAITRIDQQESRVEHQDSDAALNTARRQRQEMQTELERRRIS